MPCPSHRPAELERAMLTPIDETIWIAEGECVDFYGFLYPTRSIIVRTAGGKLWIWSPIALSPELKTAIEALGTPAFLVSPNKIHHLFLEPWKTAFPDAKLYGPQSTIDKRDDLNFEPALEHICPAEWGPDFDQAWFTGSSMMDEVVFFHRPSRTVIMADLSENFSKDFLKANWSWWQRPIAYIWGIIEGRGYAPFEWRISFFNRKKLRAARDKVLAWQPENATMAHGVWQKGGAMAFLKTSFSWM